MKTKFQLELQKSVKNVSNTKLKYIVIYYTVSFAKNVGPDIISMVLQRIMATDECGRITEVAFKATRSGKGIDFIADEIECSTGIDSDSSDAISLHNMAAG